MWVCICRPQASRAGYTVSNDGADMEDEAAHIKLLHCTCAEETETCSCSARDPNLMLGALIRKHVPDLKAQDEELEAKRREFLALPHAQQQLARSEFQLRECEILLDALWFIFKVAIACAAARPRDSSGCILHEEDPLYELSVYQQIPLFPEFVSFAGHVDRAERVETKLARMGNPRQRQMATAVAAAQEPRFDRVDARLSQIPAATAALAQPQHEAAMQALATELVGLDADVRRIEEQLAERSSAGASLRQMIELNVDDETGDRSRLIAKVERYEWLLAQGFHRSGEVPRASATCPQCVAEGVRTLACTHLQLGLDSPESKRQRTGSEALPSLPLPEPQATPPPALSPVMPPIVPPFPALPSPALLSTASSSANSSVPLVITSAASEPSPSCGPSSSSAPPDIARLGKKEDDGIATVQGVVEYFSRTQGFTTVKSDGKANEAAKYNLLFVIRDVGQRYEALPEPTRSLAAAIKEADEHLSSCVSLASKGHGWGKRPAGATKGSGFLADVCNKQEWSKQSEEETGRTKQAERRRLESLVLKLASEPPPPSLPPPPPSLPPSPPDLPTESAASDPPKARSRVNFNDIIGRRVQKSFGAHGLFMGTVTEWDADSKWYSIKYDDETCEDVTRATALRLISRHERAVTADSGAPTSMPVALPIAEAMETEISVPSTPVRHDPFACTLCPGCVRGVNHRGHCRTEVSAPRKSDHIDYATLNSSGRRCEKRAANDA